MASQDFGQAPITVETSTFACLHHPDGGRASCLSHCLCRLWFSVWRTHGSRGMFVLGKQHLVGIARNLKEYWSANFPGTIILPGGEILCGQQRKLGIKYISLIYMGRQLQKNSWFTKMRHVVVTLEACQTSQNHDMSLLYCPIVTSKVMPQAHLPKGMLFYVL